MQCSYIKPDNTQCTANAMHNSDYCCFHNPDIPEEEKNLIRAKGGHANEQYIETPLPPIKIEKMADVVTVLADSINQVRAGRISQKAGGTLAYMSFILLMAMDKAKAESKQDKIDKLKAEGKWRPEPKYAPKFYTYKDDFFLDKDGNHLVVEKDGSSFHPRLVFEPEDSLKEEKKSVRSNWKKHKKRRINRVTIQPLTQDEHEKLMDEPNYNNFSNEMNKSEEINSS